MALERLKGDLVYRFYLARKDAIADITNPTVDELNANPTNDPDGRIFNLSCALDTANTQFDLDGAELDDSTTFCQVAGNGEPVSRSATIVYGFNEAKERWLDGSSTAAVDGFNQATLAKSLLMWQGVEYYAILSVGKAYDAPFAAGDRVKIAEVLTDWAVPTTGNGENIVWTANFAKRTDIAWNVVVVDPASSSS